MGIYTRSIFIIAFILGVSLTDGLAQKSKKNKKKKSKTELVIPQPMLSSRLDSISYALGMGVAKNISTSGMDSISYASLQ
jgi:FKBP-type peptidyl-prolyl cis-trans isomerase FklB